MQTAANKRVIKKQIARVLSLHWGDQWRQAVALPPIVLRHIIIIIILYDCRSNFDTMVFKLAEK